MFLTFYKTPKPTKQISLFDVHYTLEKFIHTVTVQTLKLSNTHKENAKIIEKQFKNDVKTIFNTITLLEQKELTTYYTMFKLKKSSGGFREINAPIPELKQIQTNIVTLFKKTLKMPIHDAAYAYVEQRSSLDALKIHQENNSKWFLKLDITNFFPSCTLELLYNKITDIYPIATFTASSKTKIKQLLKWCCLNNVLPQGSPASPYLSNLLFTQYDYEILNYLHSTEVPKTQKYVYTRYADDLLITAKNTFNFKEIETEINKILTPFTLKTTKTRYGSQAGSNWNLGLMLNKDNKITTGHINKKKLKAALHSFILAYVEHKYYSIIEAQHLLGIVNYAKQIEPDYINYVLSHLTQKWNINIEQAIKNCIKEKF